jgi:predicted DNA-binding protein (MmcQ/YjbR family)
MAAKKMTPSAANKELRAFGLKYPNAHTKSPWPGHLDLAVNDKTFAYLNDDSEPFSISCKLPQSGKAALKLPFTEPTGYGLGKSGWVTAKWPAGSGSPIELFKTWIDESYRAQAPKKLVALLSAGRNTAIPSKAATARKAATTAKKTATTRKQA